MVEPIFLTNFREQKKTVEKLVEESRASRDFYLLLSISAFISTLGLMIGNNIVVIGGMLVAPMLLPILSLGMGIVTSSNPAIDRSIKNIIRSVLVVIWISLFTALLLGSGREIVAPTIIKNAELIYLLVAFSAGLAASFAWVRQNLSETLPGIAVAVSLIPPLASAGIGIAIWSKNVVISSLLIFLINLFGIVVASIIVFSLFGYANFQRTEEQKIREEEKQKEEEKEEKQKAKENGKT